MLVRGNRLGARLRHMVGQNIVYLKSFDDNIYISRVNKTLRGGKLWCYVYPNARVGEVILEPDNSTSGSSCYIDSWYFYRPPEFSLPRPKLPEKDKSLAILSFLIWGVMLGSMFGHSTFWRVANLVSLVLFVATIAFSVFTLKKQASASHRQFQASVQAALDALQQSRTQPSPGNLSSQAAASYNSNSAAEAKRIATLNKQAIERMNKNGSIF